MTLEVTFVVKAHAKPARESGSSDYNRPISPKGSDQILTWRHFMATTTYDAAYSSDCVRTMETALQCSAKEPFICNKMDPYTSKATQYHCNQHGFAPLAQYREYAGTLFDRLADDAWQEILADMTLEGYEKAFVVGHWPQVPALGCAMMRHFNFRYIMMKKGAMGIALVMKFLSTKMFRGVTGFTVKVEDPLPRFALHR